MESTRKYPVYSLEENFIFQENRISGKVSFKSEKQTVRTDKTLINVQPDYITYAFMMRVVEPVRFLNQTKLRVVGKGGKKVTF